MLNDLRTNLLRFYSMKVQFHPVQKCWILRRIELNVANTFTKYKRICGYINNCKPFYKDVYNNFMIRLTAL